MSNYAGRCQSCGMPMQGAPNGIEHNGDTSADYCGYCYQDGRFTAHVSMDDMIQACVQHCVPQPYPNEETAHREMHLLFPQLKRWKKQR